MPNLMIAPVSGGAYGKPATDSMPKSFCSKLGGADNRDSLPYRQSR